MNLLGKVARAIRLYSTNSLINTSPLSTWSPSLNEFDKMEYSKKSSIYYSSLPKACGFAFRTQVQIAANGYIYDAYDVDDYHYVLLHQGQNVYNISGSSGHDSPGGLSWVGHWRNVCVESEIKYDHEAGEPCQDPCPLCGITLDGHNEPYGLHLTTECFQDPESGQGTSMTGAKVLIVPGCSWCNSNNRKPWDGPAGCRQGTGNPCIAESGQPRTPGLVCNVYAMVTT